MSAFVAVTQCCVKQCFKKTTVDLQNELYDQYSSCLTKTQKDRFLACGIDGKPPVKKQNTRYKNRDVIWSYKLRVPEDVPVCRKLYIQLFQVRLKFSIYWYSYIRSIFTYLFLMFR